ncbi:unnamed protein product [Effrenium voratum]|nr:unnamed protein product [Effrenium voratum]
MPIVEIQVPKNMGDDAALERIRLACKQHVLDNLSADKAHHDYVTVLEVVGKPGDGCPVVKVDQRPGREKWRKEAFAKCCSLKNGGIAKTLADELGFEQHHCFVVFRESPTEHNFYVGDGRFGRETQTGPSQTRCDSRFPLFFGGVSLLGGS